MIHDITTSWQELQIENDLCDVTLACEDNQIKAYKIIISSYGPKGQLHIEFLQDKIIVIFIIIFNIIRKFVSKSFYMNYEVLSIFKIIFSIYDKGYFIYFI